MDYTTLSTLASLEEGYCFDVESLYAEFEQIADGRQARGLRYALPVILTVIALAKLAGEDKVQAIADWARFRAETLAAALGLPRKQMPHATTYRRALQKVISLEQLEEVIGGYLQRKSAPSKKVEELSEAPRQESKLLNMDGKTLRGTIAAGQRQGEHLLSVYQPETAVVLLQVAVGERENEIVAAPKLLEKIDLRGVVVTGDAIHRERQLSRQIVAPGGDYLWTIKDNQPRVREALATLFEEEDQRGAVAQKQRPGQREAKSIEQGHGRIEERRLISSTELNEYLEWPGLSQVFRVERKREELSTGKKLSGVAYGLTSLRAEAASASKLLELNRGHWGIENGLHYRRDVTFHEDQCRMKSRRVAQVMAAMNNLVIGLIRLAGFENVANGRRWYGAHPEAALNLVLR
ncbi:MAG: ISAs1 family transposase, partial [Acidobacteria bacterium]|nr:ISAs1 family transposase [Acidobacteriota bacterium]